MISLKSSVYLDSNCKLLINNNTDFKSVDNPNGLWIPGDTDTPTLKDYFINDVYFFTYIIFNKYDGTKTNVDSISNTGILIAWDTEDQTLSFPELMNKYGINTQSSLSYDGFFTVYNLLIPKESIKDEVRALSAYNYYVKSNGNVYTVTNSIETQVDLFTLIKTTTSWTSTNIATISTDVVSKCYLDLCFGSILEQFAKNYTDPLCKKDHTTLSLIKEKRDLLFSVTNTIQYYVDLQEYYKASKMIYDVTFCNVCREFLISNPNLNCGCNG